MEEKKVKKREYYQDLKTSKIETIALHLHGMDEQDAIAQLKKLNRLLNMFIREIEEMEDLV